MGRWTMRSAKKLSSRPGRYAPPLEPNSSDVSISTATASEDSTTWRKSSFFFLIWLRCELRCLMISVAPANDVVDVMYVRDASAANAPELGAARNCLYAACSAILGSVPRIEEQEEKK